MVAGSANTGEAPQERAYDYARTVALSDGVFAIALTLLVLSISVPTLASGHHGVLAQRLLDREPEFRSYAISFAVIALMPVAASFGGASAGRSGQRCSSCRSRSRSSARASRSCHG